MTSSPAPLHGVTVLAVEQYGAGPFGTMLLADLGARIVKIENPKGGDVGRVVGPYFGDDGDSLFFHSFNRNKESVALDLKAPEGKAVFHRLVAGADAVFDNLRGDLPGTLGLTYADLAPHNERIVCAHLSAYGREGARKAWPGYDYLMQAESGYLSLTGEPDTPPSRFGLSIVDMMTGTVAALALASAIIGARQTGKGRDIDVSLFDTALHNLNYLATWFLDRGHLQGRVSRSGHPSLVPSQLYRTRDAWLFVMCNKERFWPIFCRLIERADLATDPRFASAADRLENRDALTAELDAVLSQRDTADWMERLGGQVPVSPVLDVRQALENPFVAERGGIADFVTDDGGALSMLRGPIRYEGDAVERAGPRLGRDTAAVLRASGLSEAEIANLLAAGIVGQAPQLGEDAAE
ncbi:CoA transferase [Aquibium sp. A9E412]|uniref:CaiB/BaiF CoA transferase family protein n=1 Tax=Aquibium sp. A9E412 TaxID=2976767 RepID=UPI0025B0CEB6|nr:CoA transferase [Aquibium sp. A9E412]MDN2566929.1 CoA transferase [Aquibium sp. A9E412]